jgi:hypothetical protein
MKKTVELTESEWKALLEFLENLSNYQSNEGCNDLPKNIESLFTKKEGKQLAVEFGKYNCPNKPEGPDWPLPDFCLLELIKHKIETQI